MIRWVRRNPRTDYDDHRRHSRSAVSEDTIRRILIRHRILHRRCATAPFLAAEHAMQRRILCNDYQPWEPPQWRTVRFSDEVSVERSRSGKRQWCFRFSHEKWSPEMIQPRIGQTGYKFMMWACFWADGRSQIVELERDASSAGGGITAVSYLNCLHQYLLPHMSHDAIFMHDNAPIHTAIIVQTWLHFHGIRSINWPSLSPDLNPIENLWALLKDRLHERHPHLATLPGRKETVRTHIIPAIQETWASINQDILRSLAESMPRRLEACIAADGWYTRYEGTRN